jgi:hypothetical protein
MIVLGYIGDHKGEGLRRRAGREIIRLGQIGYTHRNVTHVEMLLRGTWDNADIASSSLMDGGVRIKQGVRLNPAHWLAISVPGWDAAESSGWFFAHDGEPYDSRGAVGSVLYGLGENAGWFCNEGCGASVGQCHRPRRIRWGHCGHTPAEAGRQALQGRPRHRRPHRHQGRSHRQASHQLELGQGRPHRHQRNRARRANRAQPNRQRQCRQRCARRRAWIWLGRMRPKYPAPCSWMLRWSRRMGAGWQTQ